jgi:hypothetical protein
VRDEDDPGIPGFQIWADYDNDGALDPGEPSTVSDSSGRYVLNGIRAGYRLRERLLPIRRRVTKDWRCSFPNDTTGGDGFGALVPGLGCGWGPIDPDQEVNAQRDFCNWYPAQLTVTKQLVPASDPGRFDLFVNSTRVIANAQDGSSITLSVPPGSYTLSEQGVPPADLSEYTSTVTCKKFSRRARRRAGTVFDKIDLAAGGRATCRFFNVRNGFPAIAIDKSGPAIAQAGDTLHYTMRVTNPGSVRFPADQVHVTDPGCDEPPALSEKSDGSGADDSPDFLDPRGRLDLQVLARDRRAR